MKKKAKYENFDDESDLEVSDEVVKEVEESRRQKGKDLVAHKEVMKEFFGDKRQKQTFI